MASKIFTCSCDNEYQDKHYGEKRRVCNQKANSNEYRCTICGKYHKAKDK